MADDYEGHFVIERFLGQGAFGKVYKVRPSKDRRRIYALKVVELDSYDVTLNDVMKEFNVMKNLNHRNILSIFGSYRCMSPCGRRIYSFAIQMEYCPHGDLKHYLRNRKGRLLRRSKLLNWMEDLSSAVEYIHDNKIIHKDIKPDNILLDRNRVLRISDFGIAKVMSQYYATTAIGPPYFVAPEVVQLGKYTRMADIYTLGQTFICMASLKDIPGTPDSIPIEYDRDIVDVLAYCVRDNPRSRPEASTLLGLVLDLQEVSH